MQPTMRRTSPSRVLLAMIFSFVAPSVILGQTVYWSDTNRLALSVDESLSLTPVMLGFGVFIGWPFVLIAVIAWSVLDRFDLHYAWAAALVGTANGMTVAWFTLRQRMLPPDLAWPICVIAGLVTGLGVWWIAYGRQGALKRPAPPSPRPLVL